MGSAQKPSRWVRRRKVCRVGPNVRFGPKADIRTPVLLRKIKAPFREVPISADMFRKPILAFTAIVSAAVFSAGPGLTQEKSIVVASTTSTKETSATNLYREDRHCRESAGGGYRSSVRRCSAR